MCVLDNSLEEDIIKNFSALSFKRFFRTNYGIMIEGDCLEIMKDITSNSVDTVFADPPFNLDKNYGIRSTDNKTEKEYVEWSRRWISESVRILKNGGSFFLFNIPKWNIINANILLSLKMDFRHWIAVSLKLNLPIPKRLYPCHYSLLYFSKGKPKRFNKIRTPFEICRHCGRELKDYGGHRNAMNPNGVNLTDIWTDIPPVRHKKYKLRARKENQLSTKLVERAIVMSTLPYDIVLDPFGGGGTTYAVCEKLQRKWIGIEIEDIGAIRERLHENLPMHKNNDIVEYSK
ncbi:MAG: site-specific DNA-methyltransferase [Lachnospiraceae bacterium]|nr:site-specific DNA-methyltransferase [Lachnospiraceae bacterium]